MADIRMIVEYAKYVSSKRLNDFLQVVSMEIAYSSAI
jgi:hypothetical protein